MKALEQRVDNLVAREVARIASDTLEDGFDLIVFMPGDYSDMVDEYGVVDAEKVTEYAQPLVQWKPGLAKGARVPYRSLIRAAAPAWTQAEQPAGRSCFAVSESRVTLCSGDAPWRI